MGLGQVSVGRGEYSQVRELPSLPGPYELVIVPEADSVLGETVRRARAGAEEGTLVWAESQRAARTRRGLPWEAPRGNLHCGLVLRPEFDNATAQQLCTVRPWPPAPPSPSWWPR